MPIASSGGGASLGGIARGRQCAERYAVIAVGESDHGVPAGDPARDLERRFDGVGAGRSGELDLVVQASRHEDMALERVEEPALGHRVQIERVDNSALGQIVADRRDDLGRIVPIVEHSRAGQQVEIAPILLVEELGSPRPREYRGKVAAIDADLGFQPGKGCGAAISRLGAGAPAHGRLPLPRIMSAARWPIIAQAALVLPLITSGMIEASATRRPAMP